MLLSQRPVQRPERLYIPQNTRADSRDGHGQSLLSVLCRLSTCTVLHEVRYSNDRNHD